MSTRDAVRRYLGCGFAPIPVPARAKAPVLVGWQQLIVTEQDVETLFQPNGNVGLLLGELSNGLVDVDLDAPEAVELAGSLLPPTAMIHGRCSTPQSHYWYKVPESGPTKRFQDVDGPTLVELRGTGGQTIVPPSVHPSGETIEWSNFGPPTEIPYVELLVNVERLAAASLLVKHYPKQGGRQDLALALAGSLLRAGWPPKDTRKFISEVAKAAHDEEWTKRVDAVERTAQQLKGQAPATGFKRFSEIVGRKVAAKFAEWIGVDGSPGGDGSRHASATRTSDGNHLTQLLDLADQGELFHTNDDEAFISVHSPFGIETFPVNSRAFVAWITRRAFDQRNLTPRDQTLKELTHSLTARALHHCPQQDVYLRVAGDTKIVYLDLADESRQVVEITPDGWRLTPTCAVRFHRPSGMRPLPVPKPLNDLGYFDHFFNCASVDDRCLLLSWLLVTLTPNGPYPILILQGEAGSAKSTLAKMLRLLVDPTSLPLRSFPRDERNFVIAARSSRILCFDNVSGLSDRESDTLCKVATGAGFATRQLYSDYEEVRYEMRRPVILNGIDDLATRQDAIDRAIVLCLPAISSNERQDEATLWENFERCRPFLLSALLDLLVAGLRCLPSVSLRETPRMADFARIATAAEEGIGWPPGGFMRAYLANQATALGIGIEASPVAGAIRKLLASDPSLHLTPTQLLERLDKSADDYMKRSKDWPRSPSMLGNHIRRIAPALRILGIRIDFDRGPDTNRTRRIHIQQLETQIDLLDDGVQPVRAVLFPPSGGAPAHEPASGQPTPQGSNPSPTAPGTGELDSSDTSDSQVQTSQGIPG